MRISLEHTKKLCAFHKNKRAIGNFLNPPNAWTILSAKRFEKF